MARINRRDGMCPEQIESWTSSPLAWLIDRWGRPHAVGAGTIVGRAGTLAIYAAAISRHHARLDHADGRWTVTDLGGRNGTFIDDTRVDAEGGALSDGMRLRVGPAAFLFVADAEHPHLPSQLPDPLTQSNRARSASSAAHLLGGIRLEEQSGAGEAALVSDTFRAKLTRPQVALIRLLLSRAWDDAGQSAQVRGYLPSAELLALIPFATETPDDTHLKQLIRRLRCKIEPAGLSIEGRRGLGYRLKRLSSGGDSSG